MSGNEVLGTPENSRTPEQFRHMQATVGKGKCPFCSPDPKVNVIIREGVHFNVWHNPFKYEHHQYHIMIVLKEHITGVEHLTAEHWVELGEHFAWACKEFNLPGGGLVMRFGDKQYNANTVAHFHWHVQVPDLTGPAHATFVKKITPEDEKRRADRLADFKKAE